MEDTLYTKIVEMLDKAERVDYSIQLPETEYDVMCVIWDGEWPLTTGYLMQKIGNARNWKTPTLISFLVRLEERGFIGSLKKGRERYYFPLADKQKYKQAVTEKFHKKYHDGMLISLLDALYPDGTLPETEIDAFLVWLLARR